MSEKKRVGMYKRKDEGRYRRKPRALTSIPTRSLAKSGEGWDAKVYKFKRSFLVSNNGDDWKYSSSTGYNPLNLTVTLDKLPNYTDFTTLFDSYRITGVEYRIIPHFNVAAVNTGISNTQVARLVTVVDKDDDTNLSGLTAAMQYASMEESLLDKERKRYFQPLPTVQVFRSNTSTGYQSPDGPTWIDMAQVDVPHYCAKGLICDTTASADNPRTLTIIATLYFECKGTH